MATHKGTSMVIPDTDSAPAERMSHIGTLYKQEDVERDAIREKLMELGCVNVERQQLPFEKVYFNGDMLAKYEPCMDAIQTMIDADGEDDDAWKNFEKLFGKFMDFSWCSQWNGKRYDLIIYGCSGYTGYLSMEYLKRSALIRSAEKFTFAFAGRTASKVADMRDREFKGTEWEDTAVMAATYDDPITMIDMARSARCIYNVAGPYLLTPGEIMIDACCFAGTHYIDINGEIPWMHRVATLHERAKDCNCLIVPAAAAAGGMPDLFLSLCAKQIREDYGEELRKGACYWMGGGSGAGTSGGTLATRNAMTSGGDLARKLMADPYALGGFIPERDRNGLKEINIKSGTGDANYKIRKEDGDAILSKLGQDHEEGCFCAPHTYAYFDTRVVRRSNALLADYLNEPYGREFGFLEYMMVTMDEAIAAPKEDGPVVQKTAAEEKEALEKAGKYYKQGEGPPLEDLGDCWVGWNLKVESVSGHKFKVAGLGKDGYYETARVAIESSLALVYDYDDLPIKGGVVTVAAAGRDAISARIINSGLKFKHGGWFTKDEKKPPEY